MTGWPFNKVTEEVKALVKTVPYLKSWGQVCFQNFSKFRNYMHVLLTNTSVGPKAVLFIKGIATVAGKHRNIHTKWYLSRIYLLFSFSR